MQFVEPGSRPMTLLYVFAEVIHVLAGSGSPQSATIQPVTELLTGKVVSFFAFVFFKMCTFGH